MTDSENLAAIVKAYDVRGLVDGQLTPTVVRALGAGFADEVGVDRPIVIGHDMRPSSPDLAAAAADGIRARGGDVVLIGLCSTDESYFASGTLDAPAIMFTASHNPAAYNGMKLSRAGAQAMSLDTGLAAVRDRAAAYLETGIPEAEAETGSLVERDVLADYAAYLRDLVDLSSVRPLKVVVDAANGMGGMTVPAVLGTDAGLPALPIEIVPMYFELDGTFPNHEANPLEPKNLVDLQAAVVQHDADLGLAFDGDADRCFVVDEHGAAVSPSAISAIVALREIGRVQAAGETDVVVLHNLISSRIVPETIAGAGATPIRTRVGHSLIKDEMARTNAVFGGEHSAHYYFRDFFGADNGMLAAMHVLAELGATGEAMSALADRFTPYHASGEINSTVDDVPAAYARIVEAFASEGELDELDGLCITAHDRSWWISVRPSNTEPLLRLNVEAEEAGTMERVRDAALAIIRA
ncbi:MULTISPECIES: phosphomannomutase/phosphoglucomutase [unclassified Agrococcus]|uniref:phosphomannomutase/phosphoglucomutase n=1 Tax=unclassified Agrococcus TaxID=2615065 RepID=UPI0036086CCF